MKNLFLMLVIICLASSFRESPVTFSELNSKDTISTSVSFGGAYLLFAGKFGGEINKKEIEGQRELSVDGCAKGSKIFRYTLEVTKSGKISSFKAESNVLTAEMQTKLKSLYVGDSFEFKEIKAHLPNGKEVVDVHGKKFFVV